nr:PREDICTED: synaptonemal complex protein 2-like [Anolis carolinensis]|eukprot:XP_008113194.1 PREDICTED: synaptonemal complex protein 2-like [Anolis carolinensis]
MQQEEESKEKEDEIPDGIAHYELDKNECPNLSLLKCIQQYCRSDPQGVDLLLQKGLISKMIAWFGSARESLSSTEQKNNAFLKILIENFFDTVVVISRISSEGRKQLLDSFLPCLGLLATESNVSSTVRQEAIKTLNTLLVTITNEERKAISVSKEIHLLMEELTKTIWDVGDYDMQVGIVEALFRLARRKWRDNLVNHWFEDELIAKAFKEIKEKEFETDSRKFINELNGKLGDKRRVCSIPCKAAHADMNQLNKPPDDKLEEFWIDFNYGSESISFNFEGPENSLWESVKLAKEDINSFSLQEEGGEKVLKLLMKSPTTINKREVTKINIHFDSQFDILTPLSKVMRTDETKVTMDKDGNHESGDQPQENPTASNNLERTENLVCTVCLSNILTSQQIHQSPIIKTSPPTGSMAAEESQQGAEEHARQASNNPDAAPLTSPNDTLKAPSLNTSALKASPVEQRDKTGKPSIEGEPIIQTEEVVPLEDDKLEKTNRASGKQITEAKDDAYEFETSSDPATQEMVFKMKQKVFVSKSRLQSNSGKRRMEISKSGKRLSSNYKKHLFSENNQETSSNSASEKSWILGSLKNSTPKMVYYTRKKPRVKHALKVLPLSSPDSESVHQEKRVGNSAQHREKGKKTMNSSTNIHNLSPVQLIGVSSVSPPLTRQSGLEMMDVTLPLSHHSSFSHSDDGASKIYEAAAGSQLPTDTFSKPKRKLPDLPLDLKKKRSKFTEWTLSSKQSTSIHFQPRKLFNSIEVEEETSQGQHVDKSDDNVFNFKQMEENIDDSEVNGIFESFTTALKKMFWSREKRIEIYTQSSLKSPGQHLSTLLNQIHQSRMNELENFHKIIIQELANLEKRTQFLLSLEKEAVEFCTEQSKQLECKLNAFCIQQIQRIQSMDELLDEPTENLDNTGQNYQKEEDNQEQRGQHDVVDSN